jgi:RNA polymerase-binding transcription factor
MAWKRLEFHDCEQARRLLVAKRAELARHRSADGIAVERTPDSMDELVLANERDLIVEVLNRETVLFRQVSEALERIETGTYGVCLHCGETITEKRLTALPWAALCLNCQEAADSGATEHAIEPPLLLSRTGMSLMDR